MSEIFMHEVPKAIIRFCKQKYGHCESLCFTAEEDGSSVALDNVAGTYAVSTDGITWNDYILGSPITLNRGEKVYIQAKTTNSTCWNRDDGQKFVMSGKIKASGNVQSLLDSECKRTDVPPYCYVKLFCGCDSLVQVPDLPAVTLGSYCYKSMFQECSSIVQAPQLPATALAQYCYMSMFQECASLISVPELPATTLASWCYYCMFSCCTSLKISENTEGGTKVLDLPAETETKTNWSSSMFFRTAGAYTGNPSPGNTYRCYQ